MRVLNSPAFWAVTIATVVVYLLMAATAPAHATRIVAGYDYPDLCKNRGAYAMPGKQPVLSFINGWVEYVDPEQEPNRFGKRDCQPGWRVR